MEEGKRTEVEERRRREEEEEMQRQEEMRMMQQQELEGGRDLYDLPPEVGRVN